MDIIWINNNIDMINYFFDNLCNFIHKNDDDFKLNTDEETLFNNLCVFLYENYILNEYNSKIIYDKNFEYFDLKYCSDIVDLFIEFKEISYGFTNDIFNKNKNSNDLLEFIYKNIELLEDYENDYNSDEDEKFDEDNSYY
tara:strand:+ start:239 stop:658 length:420 start_codon:yes stop_codon:yes gene_type:complete